MSKARQILNSITEADEPVATKYHTFIRSANSFSEFSSRRKRTVDTGLTYDEAKRACAAYNAELSPSQRRRGTKMEFVSESEKYLSDTEEAEIRTKIQRLRQSVMLVSDSEAELIGQEIERLKAIAAPTWDSRACQRKAERLAGMGY